MHKENIDDLRKLLIGLDKKVNVDGKGRLVPINFDNAATTPPFKRVMKKVLETSEYYGSIARGDGQKSQLCSDLYEESREYILEYFNAPEDIYTAIFVGNTTDGLNKLSNILIDNKDDIVITTRMEHHSNDLPWRNKCDLKYAEVDKNGRVKIEEIECLLDKYKERVKYVTITGASNVTGYVNDIKRVAKVAHKYGAKIIVDGAQLIPHKKISMTQEDVNENIDFLVFSGHKVYAPFGSGVIIGLREVFNEKEPSSLGGGTVQIVLDDRQLLLDTPERNEAGTPNLFGAISIAESLKQMDKIGFETIENNERELIAYLIKELKSFEKVILYGDNENISDRLGILVFNIEGMSYEKVGEYLSNIRAIGVRQGGFCSHPYTRRVLGIKDDDLQKYMSECGTPGLVRVSLGVYNSKKEANIFLDTIEYICRRYSK
ncbi:aminotransferase class V-fold PLP-dependent enzyme [Clostridium sp.]|jgi:cysteine desulfurase/selenocysteine lyase|nr:aminotransferase class V-fold PLP-dependent enzyme [Clostridium sp.]MCI9064135.1 aminotransferase class V-fold PLP-dependent enzyme [Clostridia bacterium]MCI9303118.1 aminotransferase class V-fold PLP-dependent enzyme [Clostridium sp.]